MAAFPIRFVTDGELPRLDEQVAVPASLVVVSHAETVERADVPLFASKLEHRQAAVRLQRRRVLPHPNPTKADKGKTKSRLEPDCRCAETVTQLFHWRYCETIAGLLNADLDRYRPTYYLCRPRKDNRGVADPPTAVGRFSPTASCMSILEADLATVDDSRASALRTENVSGDSSPTSNASKKPCSVKHKTAHRQPIRDGIAAELQRAGGEEKHRSSRDGSGGRARPTLQHHPRRRT